VASKITWNDKKVYARAMKQLEKNMNKTVAFLEGDCKKSMRGGSAMGTYVGGKYRKKKTIVRSAKGQPPFVETGTLRTNIAGVVKRDLLGVKGYLGVKVGPADEYASALELGTPRMKPRPYLIPTITRNRLKIGRMIAGKLN